MSGHADSVSWISGRAWKLNTWLLPRVRLWLMYKWDKPGTVGEPAQAPKKTKAALFQQAKSDRTSGHDWQEHGRNLRCMRCGCELKYYDELAKLELHMNLCCTGEMREVVIGHTLHPYLHGTHNMTQVCGRKFACTTCNGQITLQGSLSKKLQRPCKVRGR